MPIFETYIALNHEEADTVRRAFIHIELLGPEDDTEDGQKAFNQAKSALRALAAKVSWKAGHTDFVSPERFKAARKLLFRLAELCLEQSEVSYWEKALGTGKTKPIDELDGFIAVANPRAQIDVLVEARQSQYKDAVNAHFLLSTIDPR